MMSILKGLSVLTSLPCLQIFRNMSGSSGTKKLIRSACFCKRVNEQRILQNTSWRWKDK